MKSINIHFTESNHLLCRWHVNMNILTKTKKFFPAPVKEDRVYRKYFTFQEFLKVWGAVLDSRTQDAYTSNLTKFRAFLDKAVQYVENTWLILQKEKLVRYWIDQNYHFGVVVILSIEGCYNTLKEYLQRGNEDLKDIFD